MAQGSSDGEEDPIPNDIFLTCQSCTAETTTGIQLPTLPFDVLPEILCRLPMKLLGQLRCLCKSFNSLISDPKFAKKHLQLSTKRHHLMLTCLSITSEWLLYESPISSILSTSTVFTQTQLYPPNSIRIRRNYVDLTCSCDGIFCGELNLLGCYFLWNPSIRKFKLLPPSGNSCEGHPFFISFGYDHFIDNYKLISVSTKNEVSVYTLGTDYWTRIEDIPNNYHIHHSGTFVSGTVNWFAMDDSSMHFILSLDLVKESYQHLLLPNSKIDWSMLGLVRGCLCVFASSDMYMDVWIMKEYGDQESWTKLYIVPNIQDQGVKAYKALYISDDDQLLVEFKKLQSNSIKLVVYDSKTGTLNIPEFQNNYKQVASNVYIESLISP
ncbi:putative F-box domain, galactose oxidase/kelch, beta-propeller, F-box associated interaction [Medicago truncatula]|uniref:F-box protein interaction domain protein n=1 Tax=Medicago truncatula TaxID=3880 RepID=G7IWP9_MEDTR|nr:F-box/kelch-repeat protein At3g23880 [Medicago truncatula]AES69462.1 F-box protein interaction domain protein [Medicago truncatula]RHN66255.1 putative F-box domain, galactose oxidase/kelch, beta-propeller, F-box associated interaction [Medicago truncatula]